MPPDGGASVTRWRRGTEAIDADVVAVLTRATIATHFTVELDAVRPIVEDGLTWTPLFVKAAALAAMAVPDLHRMHGPLRVLEPGAADVGVSVLGEGAIAPVVVVRAADRLPLLDVAAAVKDRAAEARRGDVVGRRWLDRLAWLLPPRWLRRALIRAALASPARRRAMFGTIQVSNVGAFGLDEAYVPMVGELLLVCGAVRQEAGRTVATFVLHGSHLKLYGRTGGAFVAAFREALSSPDRLR